MASDSQLSILIATGDDRPGVLDDVSLYLHERQVAILESRVSLLRGQFGLLLLIRGDDAATKQARNDLPELDRTAKIRTELRPASSSPDRDDTPMRLTAYGTDSASALHRLSHLIRVLNVNIENVETKKTSDTDGGFSLVMDLCVPRATPIMMLKQYVQSLADECGISCEVKAL